MTQHATDTRPEYRADINLQDSRGATRCSILCSEMPLLAERIRQLTPDQTEATIKDDGPNNSLLFHPKILGGTQPFGWVTQYKVPVLMSTEVQVKTLTEKQSASAR